MKNEVNAFPLPHVVGVVMMSVVLALVLTGCAGDSASQRKAAIEDFVALQEELFDCYPDGSISYSDEGQFVEIKRVQDWGEDTSSADISYMSHVAEDQMTADMLASRIGCPVLTCDYDKDGYLFSLQVGYPDERSRTEKLTPEGAVKERMDEIAQAAEDFALSRREKLLDARCAALLSETAKSDGYGFASATYATEPDGIRFDIIEAPGYGFRAYKTDEGYAEAVEAWKSHAEFDTLLLRDNVGYRFYTSDGELDLEASSPMLDYYMNPRIDYIGERW